MLLTFQCKCYTSGPPHTNICCWGLKINMTLVSVNILIYDDENIHVIPMISLLWRHNVSNHQPHNCLLKCLSGRWSRKTSKLRVTSLCAGNSPATGEFPAQMASNAVNASIWWRHHDTPVKYINHVSWQHLGILLWPSKMIKWCIGVVLGWGILWVINDSRQHYQQCII